MATIRATCTECGDVEMTTADVWVRLCDDDDEGTYHFRCPHVLHAAWPSRPNPTSSSSSSRRASRGRRGADRPSSESTGPGRPSPTTTSSSSTSCCGATTGSSACLSPVSRRVARTTTWSDPGGPRRRDRQSAGRACAVDFGRVQHLRDRAACHRRGGVARPRSGQAARRDAQARSGDERAEAHHLGVRSRAPRRAQRPRRAAAAAPPATDRRAHRAPTAAARPPDAPPANPTAVPEPATTPELPGEQPSSGETAA